MHFISNGDYGFPFESAFYWMKYFFIWSFQNGAANPDGIIRIPSALLNALVFQAFGNVVVGYFYIFLVFVICFSSFYVFARSFIGSHSKAVAAVGALFFTFNPIFMGNLAKVGLTLAVAMLPLLLVCVKNAFDTGRFRYLLIALLLVTISLVHPFTCAVNVGLTLGYLLYRLWKSRRQKVFTFKRFVLLGLTAIAVNLYFILPIANIGTVSKDVISQDVAGAKTNYTDLVDVANTGDMLTSLSLSRNVLKDFEFYNSRYESLYMLAIFGLYIVLFAAYIYKRSSWSGQDQRRFLITIAGMLGLVLLATGTFLNIDRVIKFIIGLPGGWMFRSPLKWQLYIPIFLFAALVIVLKNIKNSKKQQNFLACLLGVFVLLNGFIFGDVYRKMLVPRSVKYFASLHQTNLDGKSILYINSNECNIFSRQHPDVQTELRQVVKSQNVQFKTANTDTLDSTKLKDYDYLMGCKDDVASAAKGTPFREKFISAHKIATYSNEQPTPYIYAANNVFTIDKPTNVNSKQLFAHDTLQTDFDFVANSNAKPKATRQLTEVFENLTRNDIQEGFIRRDLPKFTQGRTLYVQGQVAPYQKLGNTATLTVPEAQTLAQTNQKYTVPSDVTRVIYKDPAFAYRNVLPNGSLEDGLWRKQVGDCSAYDRNARIAMGLNKEDKTRGKQSLQLDTSGHIACTGPKPVKVQPGERYLISFDYKNANKTTAAGYNVGFDDEAQTAESDRLVTDDAAWHQFDTVVTVPEGAKSLSLILYAYPDVTSSLRSIALYDNISIIKVPALENNYYLVEDTVLREGQRPSTQFEASNPTKKKVHIQAKGPFYLAMKDGYNNRWVASVAGAKDSQKKLAGGHVRLNTSMNGWYVDAADLCREGGCHKNPDGSYAFDVIIEYTPQKWFVIGGFLSAIAWMVCISYIVHDIRKERAARDQPRQRRLRA